MVKGNPAPRAILKRLRNLILEASRNAILKPLRNAIHEANLNPILKPVRNVNPRLTLIPKAAWFWFRRRGSGRRGRACAHKG